MDNFLEYLLKYILPSLLVGGGFWKGADVIINALKVRGEAVSTQRRLDQDQMQSNYDNAMDLLDKQAKRIDALTRKVELYEGRIDQLNARISLQNKKREDKEMANAEEIRVLRLQVETLKEENRILKAQLFETQCNYNKALERIEALEKGDTGPLKAL